MTWYYDIAEDGSKMEIYDHTGTVSKTINNDGSGFEIPGDILQAMEDATVAEYQSNGFSGELLTLMRDAMFENIQEGTP